jgi:hypothetical protein
MIISRWKHRAAHAGFAAGALSVLFACASTDIVIGDDTSVSPAETDGGLDASAPDVAPDVTPGPDGSPADAKPDAPECPTLSPPAPGFCDGGPVAPKYGVDGCIVGYACAPILCADAGGQCVAVAPGTCASNHVGDATKYSCGGGLGTMCCLP